MSSFTFSLKYLYLFFFFRLSHYKIILFSIRKWRKLAKDVQEKIKLRLRWEVCRTCAEVCPRRGYGHYCIVKGATRLESAGLLEDCNYCTKTFKSAEEMFHHSVTCHLGILGWVCPFCCRAYHNRFSYRRHIVWEHRGSRAFKDHIDKEFGCIAPRFEKLQNLDP